MSFTSSRQTKSDDGFIIIICFINYFTKVKYIAIPIAAQLYTIVLYDWRVKSIYKNKKSDLQAGLCQG
jgi:hypothetical protein